MKKKERLTGKNYVFEQVTFDKKKTIYSTNNILNTNNNAERELTDRFPQQVYSQSEARGKADFESQVINSRKISEKMNNTHYKTNSIGRTPNNLTQTRNVGASNLSSEITTIAQDEIPFFNNRNGLQQRAPGYSPAVKSYAQSEQSSLRQTG